MCILGPEMGDAPLFEELVGHLTRAGVEVRTEPFKATTDRAGGLCRMHGSRLCLLDERASRGEQVQALLEVVEAIGIDELGLSGVDLSPHLLVRLTRRGKMPWPHPSQAPKVKRLDPQLPKPSRPRMSRSLPMSLSSELLSEHTTMKVGGVAEFFTEAHSRANLLDALEFARTKDLQVFPLGEGSNLVVADSGVSGMVLKIATRGIETELRGDECYVTAQAGESWDELVRTLTNEGYYGIECLAGIPGKVGATPIQNVGAYGQEVAETIHSVTTVDRQTLSLFTFKNPECQFAYRDSAFKKQWLNRFVILSVVFCLNRKRRTQTLHGELARQLEAGKAAPSGMEVLETVVALRKQKSMVLDPKDPNTRCAGSFFVNPVISRATLDQISSVSPPPPAYEQPDGTFKVPAAWLIEHAGFVKGYRHAASQGRAALSTKHCLALISREGALSEDIVGLAREIQTGVFSKFQVELHPEPDFWGFSRFERKLPHPNEDT